jgi:hypothetical protein
MRQALSETDKTTIRSQQVDGKGILRCFISGEIISNETAIEYDHIHPVAKDGVSTLDNLRIVIKELNRRKGTESLYDVRDNLKLEKLFETRKNNIRLQDIFELKGIENKTIAPIIENQSIEIDDGEKSLSFLLHHDDILGVDYFYGRLPISWLENDDQEGLQPRVIDFKRLITIRDHLKTHPQLAPSVGRLLNGRLKLFDGQHKLAAQVLNNQESVDIKIYVSPREDVEAKKLFDSLMITNLEAHSKLKQVPFYTSTLLDRLSVIYKEMLESFLTSTIPEKHNEAEFVRYLVTSRSFTQQEAKEMLRSAIKVSALESSSLKPFVAAASKDAAYPITMDLLSKTIFKTCLFLDTSRARFTSEQDYRNSETSNFNKVAEVLVGVTSIKNWVQNTKGRSLSNAQAKARRIWHKGSVLTWSPYLESVLLFAIQCVTTAEREQKLHRSEINEAQLTVVNICLERLFSHPMWDDPDREIDSLLVSATRQEELFIRKGLTEKYVLRGEI